MKPKILIIDDEDSILSLFKRFLSLSNYDVFSALDYSSALKIIYEVEPDLIISDIMLEGRKNGIDILKNVKKNNLSSSVIMITAVPDIETAAEAVRMGAFDYITKPVKKDFFLRVVNNALNIKIVREEKERYRRVLDAMFRSSMDGLIAMDNQMMVMTANDIANKICGLPFLNNKDKSFDKMPFLCKKSCLNVLKKTLDEKDTIREYRIECRHQTRPEQIVLLNCSPLKNENCEFLGAVLVIRDITRVVELEKKIKNRYRFYNLIGKSKKMEESYRLLEDLAEFDTTVLITGQSGTGKELAARALHIESPRSGGPMVNVNCSALAENLLESELFGHVKGAFTGAVKDKTGRFQKADGGTLFLDEIGDISPVIQVKLLRVLQEKEIERVGDANPIKVDVRVITATNRNLKEKVRLGEFREDLFYRLKVVEVKMPSLIERLDDIPLLVNHFCNQFNKRFKKAITALSDEALSVFMRYPWPGNVRELEHALEHAFILCNDRIIVLENLPAEIKNYDIEYSVHRSITDELEEITEALKETDWNKAKAARIMGISRQTIYRKIKEYNLQVH